MLANKVHFLISFLIKKISDTIITIGTSRKINKNKIPTEVGCYSRNYKNIHLKNINKRILHKHCYVTYNISFMQVCIHNSPLLYSLIKFYDLKYQNMLLT